MGLWNQVKHGVTTGWNAFRSREPTAPKPFSSGNFGGGRPGRVRYRGGLESSLVAPVYTRIAVDIAAIRIQHVLVNQNGTFQRPINSRLNYALTQEANIDQTSRAFIQDIVMSLFDEGVVAIVPIEVRDTLGGGRPRINDVYSMRAAKIKEWFPRHIRVEVYNDETGKKEQITLPKEWVAIVENPLYAIMNEPNSTLKRLIRKLHILDAIDEQSGAGKLDLIIQLPYVVKTPAKKAQAEERRKDIEEQLSGSKYGIAYTDGTERITQLNRAAENNLMAQVEYLTRMLHSQLGLTEEVFNGTADEATMLNYMTRTIEPVLSAIIDEMQRKFLTRTARAQLQRLMSFRDTFKLVTANKMADVADRYTRNEILSPNEVRGIIGFRPSEDERADELRNRNLNAPTDQEPIKTPDGDEEGD